MKRRKTSAQVAQKWAQAMASSGNEMKAGVEGVTENPAAKAAAAKDLWLQRVQEAAADDRFARGLEKTTLPAWKAKMLTKGIANMQTGAREAQADVQKAMEPVLAAAYASSDEIAGMPKGSLAESEARMVKNMRNMAALKNRR